MEKNPQMKYETFQLLGHPEHVLEVQNREVSDEMFPSYQINLYFNLISM